jgi:hypothetical protein
MSRRILAPGTAKSIGIGENCRIIDRPNANFAFYCGGLNLFLIQKSGGPVTRIQSSSAGDSVGCASIPSPELATEEPAHMTTRAALRSALPFLVILSLVGCGGGGGGGASAITSPSPSASAYPSAPAKPILNIQMARLVAADGSASSPTSVFDSAQDQKVVAVLTLANLDAGTKISYTRYVNGKYVNSRSAVLKKRAKYFYFTFKPKSGEKFTAGSYKMKFYVNEKSAGETTYQIN